MDIKDMKKLILLAICAFAVGFGCLVYYYVDYSNKTENRHMNNYEDEILNQQDIINNMQAQQNNKDLDSTKFGEVEKEYNYEDYNMDAYKEYVDEQLSLKTDKTEEETLSIFEGTMKSIRLKVLSGHYADASELAYKAMSDTVFVDGQQYASLSAIKSINGFDQISGLDQTFLIQSIYDPVVYIALFYAMEPEYQVSVLGEENFLFIPAQNNHQMGLIEVAEAGPLESQATKFFSELEELEIFRVRIEVLGVQYDVYVAGRMGYAYRITKVEFADPTNRNYSNYTDYFNVWGRKEIDIYFD